MLFYDSNQHTNDARLYPNYVVSPSMHYGYRGKNLLPPPSSPLPPPPPPPLKKKKKRIATNLRSVNRLAV